MPAGCAYTYGCPSTLSYASFSLFTRFHFTVLYLLIQQYIEPCLFYAATKRENSRKDEGPTGTGAQYKQGNIVIILVGVIIIVKTLWFYGSHACPSQNFSKWSRLMMC
jgi:hypothetical protein